MNGTKHKYTPPWAPAGIFVGGSEPQKGPLQDEKGPPKKVLKNCASTVLRRLGVMLSQENINSCAHGRPQEFFQGGANLLGGPQKICEGGPPYFFIQALKYASGGGGSLDAWRVFSRGPQIY